MAALAILAAVVIGGGGAVAYLAAYLDPATARGGYRPEDER